MPKTPTFDSLEQYERYVASKEAELEIALRDAPKQMTFRDKAARALWKKNVQVNGSNNFGRPIISFAENWARLMEGMISKGATVSSCAAKSMKLAMPENLSGSQQGFAEVCIIETWIHGEEFKRWYARYKNQAT